MLGLDELLGENIFGGKSVVELLLELLDALVGGRHILYGVERFRVGGVDSTCRKAHASVWYG